MFKVSKITTELRAVENRATQETFFKVSICNFLGVKNMKKKVHRNYQKIYLETLKSVLGCSVFHYLLCLRSQHLTLLTVYIIYLRRQKIVMLKTSSKRLHQGESLLDSCWTSRVSIRRNNSKWQRIQMMIIMLKNVRFKLPHIVIKLCLQKLY